jgi:uncharacterized membrane protein YkvA (DUF1232 family)
MLAAWKKTVRKMKAETLALYYASRDPRVPWYAKAWVSLVVAYALSPLDLIPDFIPILGYLDDLVLVPLGLAVAIRMIPTEVMAECRARAAIQVTADMPLAKWVTGLIVFVWIAGFAWLVWTGYHFLTGALGK